MKLLFQYDPYKAYYSLKDLRILDAFSTDDEGNLYYWQKNRLEITKLGVKLDGYTESPRDFVIPYNMVGYFDSWVLPDMPEQVYWHNSVKCERKQVKVAIECVRYIADRKYIQKIMYHNLEGQAADKIRTILSLEIQKKQALLQYLSEDGKRYGIVIHREIWCYDQLIRILERYNEDRNAHLYDNFEIGSDPAPAFGREAESSDIGSIRDIAGENGSMHIFGSVPEAGKAAGRKTEGVTDNNNESKKKRKMKEPPAWMDDSSIDLSRHSGVPLAGKDEVIYSSNYNNILEGDKICLKQLDKSKKKVEIPCSELREVQITERIVKSYSGKLKMVIIGLAAVAAGFCLWYFLIRPDYDQLRKVNPRIMNSEAGFMLMFMGGVWTLFGIFVPPTKSWHRCLCLKTDTESYLVAVDYEHNLEVILKMLKEHCEHVYISRDPEFY